MTEASPEEEQGPSRRVGPLERAMVMALTSALKVARLHELDNVVAVQATAELTSALGAALAARADEGITLVLGDRRLLVDGAPLRGRRGGHSWMQELIEVLERMGLGGLRVGGAWSQEAVKALLSAFASVRAREPAERARELLGLVAAIPPPARLDLLDPDAARAAGGSEADEARVPEPRRALHYYARLLALAEDAHAAVRAGGSPDGNARHLQTTLMKIVEYLPTGRFEARLLALTAQPPPRDDPLAGHAAATACLAMAAGRLLGLSRGHLVDLGLAAVFHDLGRALVGREPALDGPGESPASAAGHVAAGVAAALRGGKGQAEGGLLRLVVMAEHHREAGAERHLFSRLVALVDDFSNLELGTPWSAPVSPVEALRRLRGRHEPALVALLTDLLGPRPRGTLLRTAAGEVVVVVDGARPAPLGRRLLRADGARDEALTLLEVDAPGEPLAPYAQGLDWPRALLG